MFRIIAFAVVLSFASILSSLAATVLPKQTVIDRTLRSKFHKGARAHQKVFSVAGPISIQNEERSLTIAQVRNVKLILTRDFTTSNTLTTYIDLSFDYTNGNWLWANAEELHIEYVDGSTGTTLGPESIIAQLPAYGCQYGWHPRKLAPATTNFDFTLVPKLQINVYGLTTDDGDPLTDHRC